MAKVKNVTGKHYEVPDGYDSWLDYWEQNIGRSATKCAKLLCSIKKPLEGGHVKKVPDDGYIYLTPLCYKHNYYTYTLEYSVPEKDLLLVPDEDLKEVDD